MSRIIRLDSIQMFNDSGNFIDGLNNSSINLLWQQNLGTSNLGSFTEDSTKLTLTYPSGTSTEFYNGTYNAPRLFFPLQEYDFDIVVFTSNMIGTSNYVSTGLLIYDSTNNVNYHRFDLAWVGHKEVRAIFANSFGATPVYNNTYVWMRYQLRGSNLIYSYSSNSYSSPPKTSNDWIFLYSTNFLPTAGKAICSLFSTSVTNNPGFTHYFQDFSLYYKKDVISINNDTTSDFSDAFNNSSIDAIWSQNKGPSNLGSFTEDNTKLTISYPSGSTEWYSIFFTSPRLFMVKPGDKDFSISVYISNITNTGENGGFILLYSSVSNSDFHKNGVFYSGGNYAFYFQKGAGQTLSTVANTSGRGWVKIIKSGNMIYYYYKNTDYNNRPADNNWDYGVSSTYSGDPTKLIIALGAFNYTIPVNAQFQDFRFEYIDNKYSIYSGDYLNIGDKPPRVSNAKDDEFNGIELDPKWTWIRAGAPLGTGELHSVSMVIWL